MAEHRRIGQSGFPRNRMPIALLPGLPALTPVMMRLSTSPARHASLPRRTREGHREWYWPMLCEYISRFRACCGRENSGFWQTRELYRLDADLLAHASLLLGDLHFDGVAAAYGSTAALYAREAGVNQAVALSVQAKTERWRLRFADSAELARRGFECSPAVPIRILLACQEANAAALLGDVRGARDALNRAGEASDGQVAADSGLSAWSCPRPRQALFILSVGIQCGDPDAALRAAEMADQAWADGDPWVAATWAQVRLGAGMAHIIKSDLDAVAGRTGACPHARPSAAHGHSGCIYR